MRQHSIQSNANKRAQVTMLSGNSIRQTAHIHRTEVHQAAKLVAAFLSYWRVSLVIALLYSLCIHKIGLRISVHNFLSELVTACNKSRQKTRVTNLLSKALQDNMHEMIGKN